MSKAKDKGRRAENMVADALVNAGVPAERVPLSGSLGGKYSADVVIGSIDSPLARMEIKNRESISMQLWDWLEPVDYLVLKRNHKPALVVMDMNQWIELVKDKLASNSTAK